MRKLCLLSLLCIFASGAFATITFTATTGNWNVGSNWSSGAVPPDTTEEIKLYNDESLCIIDQTQLLYVNPKISIAGGPTGATIEILPGGYLGIGKEFRVGAYGVGGGGSIGTLNQSGGTLEINGSGKLQIGYKSGGTGTYTISGGNLLGTSGRMYIGANGTAGAVGTLIIQGTDPNIVFDGNWIYIASDSAGGDSNLGTGTLQFDLSGGAVSPIIANYNIAIDAGGGGTANLIVNADEVEPAADIVLVQNTTANSIVGAFDTFNGGSAAEGTVAVIGGAVMHLTYQYNADGDSYNNDIALVFDASSTDLAHDPAPYDGEYVDSGLLELSWVNPDPNDGTSDITCTVYLGTEPNRLDLLNMDKKEIAIANPTSIEINEANFPISYDEVSDSLYENETYYWFVDCYDPSYGPEPILGLKWTFLVAQAPKVNPVAEPNIVWLSGDPNVLLSGNTSDDGPYTILWTQVANGAPEVTIDPNDVDVTNITFTERGDYEFKVTATETTGLKLESSATVRVVVGDDACDASHLASGDPYNDADVTGPAGEPDCIVDLADFVELILNDWLNCTDTLTSCGLTP